MLFLISYIMLRMRFISFCNFLGAFTYCRLRLLYRTNCFQNYRFRSSFALTLSSKFKVLSNDNYRHFLLNAKPGSILQNNNPGIVSRLGLHSVRASHVDLGVFPDQYQVWTNVGPLATLVEAHLVLVQYHEWLPHDDL